MATARYLLARFRQRRDAAAQLMRLAGHAGAGLTAGTVGLHLVIGALPIVFVVGVGVALRHLPAAASGHDSGPALPGGLVLGLAAFLLQQLLAPLQFTASQAVARRVDAYCTTRLMRHALERASLRALEHADVADELHEANEALNVMTLTPGAATEGALALVARYTQLVGAVAIVAVVANPWAAIGAAAVALVTRRGQSAAFHQWGRLIRGFAPVRRRMNYVRDLGASTRAAKEIRTLGLLDWVERRFDEENQAYLRPMWTARRRLYGRPFLLYTALGLIGATAVLLVLAHPGRSVDLARLAMGLQAAVLCVRFGVIFPESDVKMVYGRRAWEALLEFERLCAEADRRAPVPPSSAAAPEGDIVFEDVRFGYESGRPVLDGLDLTIAAGRSTALVGVNGAGKTTLVKLMTGLYQPDSGRITCGGVDLADLDPAGWQRAFAVTFQDYVRYELTLRENVAMGAVGHRDDDEGLLAELDRAGLRDLVAGMPSGLDTPLTRSAAGGRDLSGGQWQRVALARSLFAVRHGARVLVLDEPTAQLDARGEAEFYDAFLELTEGVTSMVISHRFSSVRRADRIVVLDQGRLLESGSHDELVAAGGTYARLFDAQARRFAESQP